MGNEMAFVEELSNLRNRGLTIKDCVAAFAVSIDENPYVAHAYETQQKGMAEIDPKTPIIPDKQGAWVMCWRWVPKDEAGILDPYELLSMGVKCARTGLEKEAGTVSGMALRRHQKHAIYADWAAKVLPAVAEKLNRIDELEKSFREPKKIAVILPPDQEIIFTPAQALSTLMSLGLIGGLPFERHIEAQQLITDFGHEINCLIDEACENLPPYVPSQAPSSSDYNFAEVD